MNSWLKFVGGSLLRTFRRSKIHPIRQLTRSHDPHQFTTCARKEVAKVKYVCDAESVEEISGEVIWRGVSGVYGRKVSIVWRQEVGQRADQPFLVLGGFALVSILCGIGGNGLRQGGKGDLLRIDVALVVHNIKQNDPGLVVKVIIREQEWVLGSGHRYGMRM